jgi:hypothetical protein
VRPHPCDLRQDAVQHQVSGGQAGVRGPADVSCDLRACQNSSGRIGSRTGRGRAAADDGAPYACTPHRSWIAASISLGRPAVAGVAEGRRPLRQPGLEGRGGKVTVVVQVGEHPAYGQFLACTGGQLTARRGHITNSNQLVRPRRQPERALLPILFR